MNKIEIDINNNNVYILITKRKSLFQFSITIKAELTMPEIMSTKVFKQLQSQFNTVLWYVTELVYEKNTHVKLDYYRNEVPLSTFTVFLKWKFWFQ